MSVDLKALREQIKHAPKGGRTVTKKGLSVQGEEIPAEEEGEEDEGDDEVSRAFRARVATLAREAAEVSPQIWKAAEAHARSLVEAQVASGEVLITSDLAGLRDFIARKLATEQALQFAVEANIDPDRAMLVLQSCISPQEAEAFVRQGAPPSRSSIDVFRATLYTEAYLFDPEVPAT